MVQPYVTLGDSAVDVQRFSTEQAYEDAIEKKKRDGWSVDHSGPRSCVLKESMDWGRWWVHLVLLFVAFLWGNALYVAYKAYTRDEVQLELDPEAEDAIEESSTEETWTGSEVPAPLTEAGEAEEVDGHPVDRGTIVDQLWSKKSVLTALAGVVLLGALLSLPNPTISPGTAGGMMLVACLFLGGLGYGIGSLSDDLSGARHAAVGLSLLLVFGMSLALPGADFNDTGSEQAGEMSETDGNSQPSGPQAKEGTIILNEWTNDFHRDLDGRMATSWNGEVYDTGAWEMESRSSGDAGAFGLAEYKCEGDTFEVVIEVSLQGEDKSQVEVLEYPCNGEDDMFDVYVSEDGTVTASKY